MANLPPLPNLQIPNDPNDPNTAYPAASGSSDMTTTSDVLKYAQGLADIINTQILPALPSTTTSSNSTSTGISTGTINWLTSQFTVFDYKPANNVSAITLGIATFIKSGNTALLCQVTGSGFAVAAQALFTAQQNGTSSPQILAAGPDAQFGDQSDAAFANQVWVQFDPNAQSFQYSITGGATKAFERLTFVILGSM